MPTPKSQSTSLVVSVGVECNVGKERKENQDRVTRAATPFGDLFVVADGVGGYQGGAEAAQTTVDGFAAHLKAHGNLPLSDALQQAVRSISKELQQRSAANKALHGMGSTVVLCVVRGNRATYAHAGDSRAYLVRHRKLAQLTRDHSVMERLVSGGVLTPAQAREHPDASVLTRAIGQAADVSLDIGEITLQHNDALLLCSDGLWAYAKHEEMEAVAASENLSAPGVASAMLNLALEGGGGDNVSIQFLRFTALQAHKSPGSKLLIPAAALASVLAVGTAVMFISNYQHPLVERPHGAGTDAATPTKQAPPSPPKAPKPDEKKTTPPKSRDQQPVEAPPHKPPEQNNKVKLKVEVIVLKAQGKTAGWAGKLSTVEGVTTSPRDADQDCLSALQQKTPILYYSANRAAAAVQIGRHLEIAADEIQPASTDDLQTCGGGEILAMPAKPSLGEQVESKLPPKARSTIDASKKKIEEEIKKGAEKLPLPK